ncbi:unnamed protein product [Schistocephalus solidus]|uniref:Uncharacterized protein n=1 Tax=Schistocephalus solidus TaxID=70667 RepID=A0A183SW85_SCHSO|nr:unnamed protein product [Schistocephalus solidus]
MIKLIQTHCSNPEEKTLSSRKLRDQFMRNGYPKAFIRRCLRVPPGRTQPEPTPTVWHAMTYIKDVSEATERIVAGLGAGIAHRPKATMRSKVMRIKDKLNPNEQLVVVYRTPCQNCFYNYTGQTVSMLGSRIHKHKVAEGRGGGSSQVAAHTYETGHEFNFAATKIIAHARCKTSRESLETWVSDGNSVNRFIDLAPAYRALRSHLRTGTTGV